MTNRRGSLNPAFISTMLSATLLAVIAAIGGWMRRWIADDGLIVLRTVRNLQAGNGPVFNAGERVEANTSALWQYLLWIVAEITHFKLEVVALGMALGCTVAAVFIGALGAGHLYRRSTHWLLAPVGGLVYLCLPPARDFATSGLEWGLSLLWLALLWLFLVLWSDDSWPWIWQPLALWAGLSWLVRPELALYGGVVALVLLFSAPSWRRRMAIMAWGLPLPLAYEIFRMGYYGLLTPHTAVAKSASGAEWASGWHYLTNFAHPYVLWLVMLIVIGLVCWQYWVHSQETHQRRPLRSHLIIVGIMLGCSALHVLYVIRVGGDFMHGRMLLIPLFAALLPIMVLPVVPLSASSRRLGAMVPGVVGLCLVVAWGGIVAVRSSQACTDPARPEHLGVIDEREFWTCDTQRAPGDGPKNAEDFLRAGVMRDFQPVLQTAIHDHAAQLQPIVVQQEPTLLYSWMPLARPAGGKAPTQPLNLYPTVLGTPGMIAPLDVRVHDAVGLATPLAARMPRIEGARIGHDKWLPVIWQVAASDADIHQLPGWINRDDVVLARAALQKPEFQELFATYQDPMSFSRFMKNIRFALTTGRHLQFSANPRDYFTEAEIAEILHAN
ncbi:hypothetical protein GSS88_02385 [Corynebacterium sp. 3HC-13]|uniref:flagellar motor control protein ZomB n=1 Tax=Corynebacterium poyangense TaxID=2684405 RepID=UPI001CCBC3D1|nr:flagellar motor control protein ZomB [Corynebacterium poyangense]MBZ8176646.1 hypothetical protein [Corynebacterium poyangense]